MYILIYPHLQIRKLRHIPPNCEDEMREAEGRALQVLQWVLMVPFLPAFLFRPCLLPAPPLPDC